MRVDVQSGTGKQCSPTILITNFHSALNAGDAAALEQVVRQLRVAFLHPRLVLAANYPAEEYLRTLDIEIVPSFMSLIADQRSRAIQVMSLGFGLILGMIFFIFPKILMGKSFENSGWGKLLSAYRDADLVISAPGNIFHSMGLIGWIFIISAVSIAFAHLFDKPVYVMPQTLGPIKRYWERYLLKKLFDRARMIFVRDIQSLRLAGELRLPQAKVKYIPDIVFDFSVQTDTAFAKDLLKRHGFEPDSGSIGVTAINPMLSSLDRRQLDSFYSAMARQLAQMVAKYQVRVFFFSHVTGPTPLENDAIAARDIIGRMQVEAGRAVLFDGFLLPAQLKALYGLMDIFVATRMHSGIFAISMGVPTLFVGYLQKTRGMLESLGLQEWLVEIDDFEQARFGEKLEGLWLRRDEIRRTLMELMPRLAEQTRQVGRIIAEDYCFETK
jgi:colanic acid/amylovoran biosynthesis protein WcaK/AmsJ